MSYCIVYISYSSASPQTVSSPPLHTTPHAPLTLSAAAPQTMAFSAPAAFKPGTALCGVKRPNETGAGIRSYTAGVGVGLGKPSKQIGALAGSVFDTASGIKRPERRGAAAAAAAAVESIDSSSTESETESEEEDALSRTIKKTKADAKNAEAEEGDNHLPMGVALRRALIHAEAALKVMEKSLPLCIRTPPHVAYEAQKKVVEQLKALVAWEDATEGPRVPLSERTCCCFECT